MTKKLPNRVLLSVIALFFSLHAFSQLPAFNFSVTATDQTCLGNGVLNFTVSGLQTGAGVTYAVYLQPNTTTPVATVTNTTVPGLVAGNYTIVATQSLNGDTSTNTKNATINNLIIPLTYTLGFTQVKCGNDGTITATATSGYPSTYEILTGPVTKPPQASNTFTGLPAGLYGVRVTDTCGEAVVISITVTQALTAALAIGNPVFDNPKLPSCNLIQVSNFITLVGTAPIGATIFYPLTIQYTVFPPGGGTPIVVTLSNYMGGPLDPAVMNIPFYNNQQYTYNITVTNACGQVTTKNNMVINRKFDAYASVDSDGCTDNFFFFDAENYVGPININFTAFPAGFNASGLNVNHPNFPDFPALYGGLGAYPPNGSYTAIITDGCGRTDTVSFELMNPPPPQPMIGGDDAGCGDDGVINIHFNDVEVTNVVITAAPPAYSTGPFPIDVTAGVDEDGNFELTGVPAGTYTFLVTDECGNVQLVPVVVAGAVGGNTISIAQRPGCEPGYGSVKIVNGQKLTSFTIIAAPSAFTETLPYDGSANIYPTDGAFYMNSLPGGSYTVQVENGCGSLITQTFTVNGYTELQNNLVITPHCGSFDLNLQHTSNGNYVATFYLQKYYPLMGAWGNPQTGILYVEGGQANVINSIPLTNNFTTLSLPYTGQFRVIKTFFVYDNGSIANVRCTQILHTFDFDGGPVITDAYSFPCDTGLSDVAVIAEGVPPLTYGITTKEGQPFVLNNGQSNLFTGLESATYNFRVTDVCGNIRNILLDIDALDPITIQADGFCEGEDSKLYVQEFSFIDYKWYKEGAPGTVLSTSGTLDFPDYESLTDAGVYHLSVTSDNPLSCMNQELSFSLLINAEPDAGDDITTQFCNDGQSKDLRDFLADDIVATGDWEDLTGTGLLTNSLLTTAGLPEGTYSFRYTVSGLCSLADDAILTLDIKNVPPPPVISVNTPLCEGSDLQFSATAVAGAVYEWTGPNGFTSTEQAPILNDISVTAAGTYSLAVTVNGCTSSDATFSVLVNAAPKSGEDAVVPLCNEGNVVDLRDYLSGTFDTGGVWEDVDGAGALNGNDFATEGVAEGTYQFRYTVSNICNVTDEAIISIQLKDIPQAPALTAVAPVCEGADVQLSAETITNAVYQWSGPDGFTSAEQNPLIAAATTLANGDYSVNVTVNGCTSAMATVPVTINAFPQFTVEGNTVLCEGQASLLTVVPDNFDGASVSYQWYLEGSLLAETSGALPISQIGTYEVTVDNNACTSNREIAVTLNDNPFELVLDSGCVNYDYMLWVANIAEISGAAVTWTGPGNFIFTGPEANITNGPEGEYTATVTNDEGCTAIASITIDNTSCIIPKGVSPNGDGLNDSFDLSNLDVIELKIFNRYGLKVYEARDYLKEWHGQSEKGTLPTATYYYVITLSAGKQVTGWVYLQREE
jgi:gliding motility-associated-like protein